MLALEVEKEEVEEEMKEEVKEEVKEEAPVEAKKPVVVSTLPDEVNTVEDIYDFDSMSGMEWRDRVTSRHRKGSGGRGYRRQEF